MKYPYLGTPSQYEILHASAGFTTELAFNDELVWRHLGEDGLQLEIEGTREFSLERQQYLSGTMQDWAMDEVYDLDMLCEMQMDPVSTEIPWPEEEFSPTSRVVPEYDPKFWPFPPLTLSQMEHA